MGHAQVVLPEDEVIEVFVLAGVFSQVLEQRYRFALINQFEDVVFEAGLLLQNLEDHAGVDLVRSGYFGGEAVFLEKGQRVEQ